MLCPNCKNDIEEGSFYCTTCGVKLSSYPQYAVPTYQNAETLSVEVGSSAEIPDTVNTQEANFEQNAEASDSIAKLAVTPPQTEPEVINNEEFFKKYDLYFTPQGQVTPKVSPAPRKKKSKAPLIIIGFLSVLACVIVAVVVIAVIGGIGDNDYETSSRLGSSKDSSFNESSFGDSSVSSETSSSENESSPVINDKLDKETIIGDWGFELSVRDVIAAAPESEQPGFETDAAYKFYLRFNEDKTVQLVCLVDDYKSAYRAYMSDYFDYLRDGGYYEMREKEGYSKEQTDKMLADTGMTVDLLVDDLEKKMQSEDIAIDKPTTEDGYILFTDPEKSTQYTLEKNKITFVTDDDVTRETYISFEHDSGVMTVTEGTYADGMLLQKQLVKK